MLERLTHQGAPSARFNPLVCFPADADQKKIIDDLLNRKGWIAGDIMAKALTTAHSYARSKNFIVNQGLARLSYAAAGIAAIVARTAQAAIALIAISASLLALGKIKFLNRIAFRTLDAPAIIHDVLFCAIKVLNPQADHQSEKEEQTPVLI